MRRRTVKFSKRVRILVDVDSEGVEKVTGVPATQEELDNTLLVTHDIEEALRQRGWPAPLRGVSGNGTFLALRGRPAQHPGIYHASESVLEALPVLVPVADETGRLLATIDPTMSNAARLTRVGSTINRRGDGTPDRPHRRCEFFEPDPEDEYQVGIVSREKIEEIAKLAPDYQEPETPHKGGKNGPFEVESYLPEHNVVIRSKTPYQGGTRYHLETCPCCGESDKSAVVIQGANGKLGFRCHHKRCYGKGWKEFRETIDPGWQERRQAHQTSGKASRTTNTGTGNSGKAGVPPPPEDGPLPFVPFPTSELPPVVRDFIRRGAKALGCDESYIALPLLAVLVSAVGNSRRIYLKASWREPLVVRVVIVGPPGTLKSPAWELALEILPHLQSAAFARWHEEMESWARDKAMYDADLAAWKKSGRNKSEPAPSEPKEPEAVRYLCEDTTVEALVVLLERTPRGLLIARDELSGWVNSFDAYKSCRGADVAHYLSMHRAGSLTVDRKTGRRVIHVPRAAVSITGTVQSKVLASALCGRYAATDTDEAMDKPGREHFDNGLAARLLYAMPPVVAKRWTDDDMPDEAKLPMRRLIERLLNLEMGTDENGDPIPVDVRLTPIGKQAWVTFYNAHAARWRPCTVTWRRPGASWKATRPGSRCWFTSSDRRRMSRP